jgi:two-component system, OmpR family, KDP operon response regulator KdpE
MTFKSKGEKMGCKYNIVVAEHEKAIQNIMKTIFEANDYKVYQAYSGKEAIMMISSRCPDAVILALELPDIDGEEIIRQVRSWSEVPIIVVSSRTKERDKVNALDLGADDFISKPFGTSELLARLRASLRHADNKKHAFRMEKLQNFVNGELCVDYSKRIVTINNADVHLTQMEYRIVSLLAKNSGKILTYDYLLKNIWGPSITDDNQILRVNMANIRKKIEKNSAAPVYISTETGIGYRMNESES